MRLLNHVCCPLSHSYHSCFYFLSPPPHHTPSNSISTLPLTFWYTLSISYVLFLPLSLFENIHIFLSYGCLLLFEIGNADLGFLVIKHGIILLEKDIAKN